MEEKIKLFEERSGEQKHLIQQLDKLRKDFKKSNQARKLLKSAEVLENLEQTFTTFKENDQVLVELNENGEFSHRSYFKSAFFKYGEDAYKELKALLEVVIQAHDAALQSDDDDGKSHVSEGDEDTVQRVLQLEQSVQTFMQQQKQQQEESQKRAEQSVQVFMQQQKQQQEESQKTFEKMMEMIKGVTISKTSQERRPSDLSLVNDDTLESDADEVKVNSPQKTEVVPAEESRNTSDMKILTTLTELMSKKKNEGEIPDFPKNADDYMIFRNEFDNWRADDAKGLTKKSILQKLRDTTKEKNEKAYNLIKHLQMLDDNLEVALDLLDERYLNVKTTLFKEVEKLIQLKKVGPHNSMQLQELHDTVVPAIANMRNLIKYYVLKTTDGKSCENKINELLVDGFMTAMIYRQLDEATLTALAGKIKAKETPIPKMDKVIELIKERFSNLQRQNVDSKNSSKEKSHSDTKRDSKSSVSSARVNSKGMSKPKGCLICKKSHDTKTCFRLTKAKDVKARWDVIKEKNICANCVHAIKGTCKCKDASKGACPKCNYKHNILFHDDEWKPQRVSNAHVTMAATRTHRMVPILPTAKITLATDDGLKVIQARVFLDSGATHSFITQECVDKLGAQTKPTHASVTTYCGSQGPPVNKKVNVKVSPHFKSEFMLSVTAYVTKSLGGDVPITRAYFEVDPSRCDLLMLADDDYDEPQPIDMILGAVEFAQVIRGCGKVLDLTCDEFGPREPMQPPVVLMETRLGYVVLGKAFTHKDKWAASALVLNPEEEDPVDMQAIARFFEHELDKEEKADYVTEHFNSTVIQDEKGYKVMIPWKSDKRLGDSRKMSMARIRGMMKRMTKEMLQDYVKQWKDLRSKGYIIQAPAGKPAKNFVGNFGLKTNSSTTPIRILFTCDQKTSNGKSVNDIQYCGPKLQNDLPSCIIKFRYKKVAITGDIEKMYLRIRVDEEDAAYQRTFVGTTADGPLEEVELPTVIFGMRSAPFLALSVLLHIAKTVDKTHPVAAKMLRESFYVDDLLDSFDSVEEAQEALQQIVSALDLGKFELKKVAASQEESLENIPPENRLVSISKQLDEDFNNNNIDAVKVLGIKWDKKSDQLYYTVKSEPKQGPVTKRYASSVVAKIYDPAGALAPALLGGKLLIQEMWKLPTIEKSKKMGKKNQDGWDDPIPKELSERFKEWEADLPALRNIKIDRWLKHDPSNVEEMLIGFADASPEAYGCVIYHRVLDKNGTVSMSIVGAKARVTPSSKNFVPVEKADELTLPRLELMAAEMLAKYMEVVKKALNFDDKKKVIGFTDSKITLAWIQGDENRWNTFVYNRVVSIKKIMPSEQWHYVNTSKNPADLASRGVKPSQLWNTGEAELWFFGPDFTRKLVLDYEDAVFTTTVDAKKNIKLAAVHTHEDELRDRMERCSTWERSVKVMVFVLRWKDLLTCIRARKESQATQPFVMNNSITSKEYQRAQTEIIKREQAREFAAEIVDIHHGKTTGKAPLKHLNPFLDKEGLLRVGGRLEKAHFISYDEKHPVVLPKMKVPDEKMQDEVETRSLTRKIIDWAHIATLHGGELKTLTFLKQRFYIPNARSAIRFALKRCMVCRTHRASTYQQLMGQMPKDCVNPAPPFYHTTTDYAGPISIKQGTRRTRQNNPDDERHIIKNKAWIAIYVCRTTGAYHIELVPELTATACVDAFKRFVSTRGLPKTVMSDNAGNFTKAKKLIQAAERNALKIAIDAIRDGEKEIQRQFAFKGVEVFTNEDTLQWKFIPPLSPEFGGKHEAAVKQVKIHLKKVIGEQKLPMVMLNTVLKQVEAMLNSRPLCKAEGSALDRDQIITPAHFWLGRPLNALPEPDYTENVNLTERFQHQQQMVQHFWKLWHTQYLHTLQQLPKWTSTKEEVQVGEIVLLKEDNSPPQVWRKARVTQVFPGKDGHVRVVMTQDASRTEFKRSIRKIVRLPVVFGRGEAALATGEKAMMPLVEPQPPPNKPVDEENKKTTKPENRRSARIAGKISMSSAIMMFMCMLTLVMPALAQQESMTIPWKNEPKNGLTYFFNKDILIRIGTQHVEIGTSLKPHQSMEQITNRVQQYGKACERAYVYGGITCWSKVEALGVRIQHTAVKLNAITPKAYEKSKLPPTRVKRSFRPGFLFTAMRWLIGSWSDDTEDNLPASKSSGLIAHTIMAFQNVERQISNKEQHVEEEINRLTETLDAEDQKVIAAIDKNKLNIQLLGTYDLIMQQINEVEWVYEHAQHLTIDATEMTKILDKVKNQVQGGVIPQLDMFQWAQLVLPRTTVKDGSLSILLDIPVVMEDVFKEYAVIPLPLKEANKIPAIPVQDIIINQKLQSYIAMVTLTAINDTLAISTDSRNTLQKWTNTSDCSIRGIFEEYVQCPVKVLPLQYDVWVDTPLHNHVAYYSNMRCEIICSTVRASLEIRSGVITIPAGCRIETPSATIIASSDKNSVERHAFEVAVLEQEMDWTAPTTANFSRVMQPYGNTSRINDDVLEDVLKDAVDASQEFSTFELTVIIVSAMIFGTVLVVAALILYFKLRRPAATDNYEVIELKDIVSQGRASSSKTNRTNPTKQVEK